MSIFRVKIAQVQNLSFIAIVEAMFAHFLELMFCTVAFHDYCYVGVSQLFAVFLCALVGVLR